MSGTYGRTIETATINLQRGNAETVLFRFRDEGGVTALDLTGKTLVFRAAYGALVIRKYTGSGLDVPDPTTGEATAAFSDVETRSLPVGTPVPFEVELQPDKLTILEGSLVGRGGTNDE